MPNYQGKIRACLLGNTYGRLTVIGMFEKSDHRRRYLCRCACGNVKRIAAYSLTSGRTQSCGCLRKDLMRARATTIQGHSGEKLHGVWNTMKQRCSNPRAKDYRHYGARGVTVCREWAENYEAFRSWALQTGYQSGLTIDRIDPNGNYEPNNCRRLTIQEQQRNRRPLAKEEIRI